ncbi:MAG: N-formylglutamate amidohydrolase [Candidatus Eisenbacteria bacterium]
MTEGGIWKVERGDGPLVAVAVHHGHAIRDELASLLAIDEQARLREEDPFTGEWTAIAPVRCVVLRSRFEVDLNRPRDRAVYREPADAWGLDVWKREPPDDIVARSLDEYDAFYDAMGNLLADIERRHGGFVLFDLHSYNHRREGPDGPEADAAGNPQVNVGTGSLDRTRWGGVVDGFMSHLRSYDFPGGELDVRENVKFKGGHFVRWVHETFPSTGCALAIEFKKFFMDEWTGEPDRDLVAAIGDGLRSTVPEVLEEMRRAL